jgi:hypothetical protein
MRTKSIKEAQNPLILRCHRLIEAFTKSDDERDFYLDRQEGFIIYVDLDKPQDELESLEGELRRNGDRYYLIPKLTFYETKKIMEGFVNEKVYDIDTKEKLLEIIQSKEARENFLEFIYDHHSELEKWQQFYQERSRIRIIEWLRNNQFHFVFEEDLDLPKSLLEKVKRNLFDSKAGKDIVQARKLLFGKAKTYYSNEALNPRPKRGRPPKQAVKLEIEPQITTDVYTTVPSSARPFLFIPDLTASAVTFSSKFETEEQMLAARRHAHAEAYDQSIQTINQKLAALRNLSNKWLEPDKEKAPQPVKKGAVPILSAEDEVDNDHLDYEEKVNYKNAGLSRAKPKAIVKPKVEVKPKIEPKKPIKKAPPKAKISPSVLRKAKPIKNPKKVVAKPAKPAKAPVKKGKIKLMDAKTAKGKPKQKIKASKPAKLSIKNKNKKGKRR